MSERLQPDDESARIHSTGVADAAVVPPVRRSRARRACTWLLSMAAAGFAALLIWRIFIFDPTAPVLAEEERQYLWEVEHCGTVLSEYGFSKLKTALRSANSDAFATIFAADFEGRIPARATQVKGETAAVRGVREVVAAGQETVVSRSGFADYLLEYRARFAGTPGVSISLMNLAPLDRSQFDGTWRGSCRLRLSGEALGHRPCEVTLFLEFDLGKPSKQTYEQGGWIHACRVLEARAAEADHYMMRNVTAEWGIDVGQLHDNWNAPPLFTVPTPGGVYVFDYNRDALMDLLVTDVTRKAGALLYQGQVEGGFRDVSQEAGLPAGPAVLAIVADLDGDGWEDVVLPPNHVLRNVQGERFENVSSNSNLCAVAEFSNKRSSGAAIADFNRDGLIDLFVCRGNSRPDRGSWLAPEVVDGNANVLLQNVGNFQFQDVTPRLAGGAERLSTFTALWFDADHNDWPDLYVINEFGDGVLLINEQGNRFAVHKLVDTPTDFGSMGATVGDVNNDGWPDLYIASMYSKSGARVIGNLSQDAYPPDIMRQFTRMVAGSQLYWGGPQPMQFRPVGEALRVADVGWAYGPALVDLDNDGWQDIFATAGFLSRTRDKPDG